MSSSNLYFVWVITENFMQLMAKSTLNDERLQWHVKLGAQWLSGLKKDTYKASFKILIDSTDYNFLNLEHWVIAAGHALYALNVSTGGMIKLASTRPFRLPIVRDVLIITFVTLIFHLITLSTITGFISNYAGRIYTYDNIRHSFLLTSERRLVIIAIVAESTNLWVLASMIKEKYQKQHDVSQWRKNITLQMTVIIFLGMLVIFPFILPGGPELLRFLFMASLNNSLIIGFFQLVTIAYIYGFRRFSVNIRNMVGGSGPLNVYWWFNWTVIAPFFQLSSYVLFFMMLSRKFIIWLVIFSVAPITYVAINLAIKSLGRGMSRIPITVR
ncbi:hypothetical protein DICVIV_11146 [Dictyocaulus viviparus]|uniref:Uncharacterized protein n=1 Tax=Dictyocaulus viviparus TaxID=29172 RepID=A0A0D8XGH7_DICVI|nr:hypothetical protein DICVIV_11146 [Dictyocaulus viviparus]